MHLALYVIVVREPQQVTILSPYLGQVRPLKQKAREAENSFLNYSNASMSVLGNRRLLRLQPTTLKVHTVDMYEGDENDIVIVSLVHSNALGDVGFLKQKNRRCVAQSGARCGLYFIANRETLLRHST